MILSFKLNIISSKLTNTTHYTSYQQKLYRLVKFLKEERNISFKGISLILDQKNYKTIRTNKIIKPHNLDSTYRKGKVRENRINRDFESQIEDLKFKILRKNWCLENMIVIKIIVNMFVSIWMEIIQKIGNL